jgi:hypothetical protein
LLSRIPADGSYLPDVLPGMLLAGLGLGISGTALSVGIFTGAREDEAGMLSGISATGHEVGGTLGIAIYPSIAASAAGHGFAGSGAAPGIAHAFLIATFAAAATSVAAAVLLPSAETFLHRLRLNPQPIAAH